MLIGGGGLLNCLGEWNNNIRTYCRVARCIVWSVGRNTQDNGAVIGQPITAEELASISVAYRTRDATELPSNHTLLDTTCLQPAFDTPCKQEGVGTGWYLHKREARSFRPPNGTDRSAVFYNDAKSIKQVKQFMCRYQRVVSTSYHGLLWSFYLRRASGAIPMAWSSKFELMPFRLGVDDGAEVLRRCRVDNRAFYLDQIAPLLSEGVAMRPANGSQQSGDDTGTLHSAATQDNGEGLLASVAVPPAVPQIVHQQWKCRTDDCLPDQQRQWRDNCKRLNPGWRFVLHDDATNRALVAEHVPWLLPTYDGYSANISRYDAIRWVYLHVYGGVYLDLDYTCVRPLAPLLQNGSLFFAEDGMSPWDGAAASRALYINPWSKQLIDKAAVQRGKEAKDIAEGIAMKPLMRDSNIPREPVGNSFFASIRAHPAVMQALLRLKTNFELVSGSRPHVKSSTGGGGSSQPSAMHSYNQFSCTGGGCVSQMAGVWFAREVLFSLRDRRFVWEGVRVLPSAAVCPLSWDNRKGIAEAIKTCTQPGDLPRCRELFPKATCLSFWTGSWTEKKRRAGRR